MAEEARMEIQDSDIKPDEDKTPEKNEVKEALKDLPSEDGDLEGDDKGKSPKKDDESDDGDKKVNRSEIAQKIKWRDRYNKAKDEIERLKSNPSATPKEIEGADEKEKQARDYLKKFFREEYESVRKEEKEREAKILADFNEAVEEVLEDNPDIKEKKLLDVVEEFEVDPKTAVKIIKKWEEQGLESKSKPKMPLPKRATPGSQKEKPDDRNKSMFQVAQDVIRGLSG